MSMEMNKALVEQAGGDERAAFEQWLEQHMSHHFSPELDLAKYEDSGEYRYNPAADYWKAWQARAALAKPSPAPVCTTPTGENCPGDGVKSCKKCPEQAEGERPKVVARVVHSNPFVLGQCGPLNANDELMTVAQHAASVARWAEMFNRVEQERDAALARVAELEQKSAGSWTVDTSCGRPILMYEGCSVIEDQTAYEVIRMIKWIGELERQEPVATVAKVPGEDWNSLDLHCNLQDIPPGTKLYAAPVAQAQHSLPEGWMLVECGIWTQEQVDEMQKTVARFRNSEFVDNRALAMAVADAGQCKAPEISLAELLAAAPGKEVPQAWLDVQAERRRQVEVEGYHGFRDNHYISYELSKAARAYIEVSWHALSGGLPCKKPESWPWMAGFKWSDGRTMLVKACALALAEIERLDRAAHGKEGV